MRRRLFADQLFGFNQFGAYSVSGSTVSVILDQLSFSPGFTPPAGTTTTLNRFDTTAVSYLRAIGDRQASFGATEVAFFAQDAHTPEPDDQLRTQVGGAIQSHPGSQQRSSRRQD